MNKALMKSVGRRELAPVTHRVTDIAPSSATRRRNNPVAFNTKPVGPGTFVFLLRINCEVASWCWLGRNADGTGNRHQGPVALHDVDILFGKRNLYPHGRWIIRL